MSRLDHTSRIPILVAALMIAASPAVGQPAYEAYVIEPWDDSYDFATSIMPDINELNTGVGTANISGVTLANFLWTEAGGKEEADIGPQEINNLGVTASNHAVYWAPGDFVEVPTPDPGGSPAITDLNNLNVVVANAAALGISRAIVWDQANGSRWLDDYGLPDETSYAYAINDSGRIAAAHHVPSQFDDERAFVFDLASAEYFDLHAMLNPSGVGITRAVDVAENGLVAGEGAKEAYGGGIAAFIWNETDGFTFLPGLNGGEEMRVHPRSVNSTGTVVGRALDGQDEWRGFIWNPDYGMHDLEEVATLPSGFNLQEALVINENGWIVALGFWGETFGPQRAVVFVPAGAPSAKLVQMLSYGADVLPVAGTYDDAFELSLAACDRFGWVNRNTGFNPYTIEGKKTAALEIAAAMAPAAPDVVVVTAGDGVITAGLAKGFADLEAARLIARRPRLIVVQPEGTAAIATALRNGADEITPVPGAASVADSLTVETPRNAMLCLREVRASAGAGVVVSDQAIVDSIPSLARLTGVFAEPAAAAALAGLETALAEGLIGRDERVVLMITGSGLKDVVTAARAVQTPEPITPTVDAVEAFFENRS